MDVWCIITCQITILKLLLARQHCVYVQSLSMCLNMDLWKFCLILSLRSHLLYTIQLYSNYKTCLLIYLVHLRITYLLCIRVCCSLSSTQGREYTLNRLQVHHTHYSLSNMWPKQNCNPSQISLTGVQTQVGVLFNMPHIAWTCARLLLIPTVQSLRQWT